jgi:uncharacterized protein (TIGR03086 family)
VTNALDYYRIGLQEFDKRVHAIADDQWGSSTPCAEWNVHDLVNHVVGENRWLAPLLAGKTIADVGDTLDGDLLGNDPKRAWDEAREEALSSVEQPDALERTVHLSYGDTPADAYINEIATDHAVHAWDLARAIGIDEQIDPDLVEFAYRQLEPKIAQWREAGIFGDEVEVPEDAERLTQLLAMTGRKA